MIYLYFPISLLLATFELLFKVYVLPRWSSCDKCITTLTPSLDDILSVLGRCYLHGLSLITYSGSNIHHSGALCISPTLLHSLSALRWASSVFFAHTTIHIWNLIQKASMSCTLFLILFQCLDPQLQLS